jgi:hypothetical protein
MIADFATQMVDPPRVRCIGVDLLPFSVGHELLLRKIGNAFVVGGFPTYEHLVSAAFICAHTWEENQKLLRSRARRWLTLRAWGMAAGKFDVAAQTVALFDYIRHAREIPETKPAKGSGVRHLVSEWDARLFAYLRLIGYSDSEILNMPLQRANLLFVAHLEEAGLMECRSRRDLRVEEQMIRLVEEMERAGAKEGFAE